MDYLLRMRWGFKRSHPYFGLINIYTEQAISANILPSILVYQALSGASIRLFTFVRSAQELVAEGRNLTT
jgi:hypothetical protein